MQQSPLIGFHAAHEQVHGELSFERIDVNHLKDHRAFIEFFGERDAARSALPDSKTGERRLVS
jgi:hypothetical protein